MKRIAPKNTEENEKEKKKKKTEGKTIIMDVLAKDLTTLKNKINDSVSETLTSILLLYVVHNRLVSVHSKDLSNFFSHIQKNIKEIKSFNKKYITGSKTIDVNLTNGPFIKDEEKRNKKTLENMHQIRDFIENSSIKNLDYLFGYIYNNEFRATGSDTMIDFLKGVGESKFDELYSEEEFQPDLKSAIEIIKRNSSKLTDENKKEMKEIFEN